MQKNNPNIFMHRKQKFGTLPVGKPNRHRTGWSSMYDKLRFASFAKQAKQHVKV